MSWGTCYAGSNNIHFDFPPIMNDGRNFAHWIPSAEVSELIRKDAGIKHNHEYRTYLVNNADYLIKNNQITACDQCCNCPPKYGTGKSITDSKYLYNSCSDSKAPFGYESVSFASRITKPYGCTYCQPGRTSSLKCKNVNSYHK